MPALLRVEQGDISAFDGDAVVNAANNHLVLGAGVAGAIARRGGGAIQRECDAFVQANGPLSVGQAALTGGGDLPARYVIHAAAMGDEPPSADSIRSSTRQVIEITIAEGMRSVAFPVLGSGVGGFPLAESARLMIDEIRSATADSPLPEVVVLYGYTADDAEILRRLIA